jgi:hypothetical protein
LCIPKPGGNELGDCSGEPDEYHPDFFGGQTGTVVAAAINIYCPEYKPEATR